MGTFLLRFQQLRNGLPSLNVAVPDYTGLYKDAPSTKRKKKRKLSFATERSKPHALSKLDIHGSVHHNTDRIEITNKMRPCSRIYYSNVS